MRELSRIGYSLAVLALLAPAAARAQQPEPVGVASTAPAKHRRGLFAREHLCAHCQATKTMRRDGVFVPPPPMVPGSVGMSGASCTACGGSTAAAASNGQVVMVQNGAPMYVQPGQPMMVQNGAPMYVQQGQPMMVADPNMMVIGPDPAPIGAAPPRFASAMPRPGMPGTRDSAVMASSLPETPVAPPGANRPRVISHLLGVSGIGRDGREGRARRKQEAHASIPYGQPNQPVNELPAKMVYGRR